MIALPLVTVICTCYNHESYVIEALNSIKNQTYQNIQLIIIDDFSTDNSKNVIKSWLLENTDILFLENSRNIGNVKTFNNAYKHAKGKYLIDFAADDILLEHCIAKQIETFQKSCFKDLGIVYGNINLMDENKKHISIYYNETETPESGDIYKMIIGQTTKICSIAAMIKSSVFEAVSLYDKTLAYEDLDLWVRVSREYNFEYIPLVLAQKRELSNSLSAHFLIKNNSRAHALHKTTLKILEKILALNTSKDEYRIMLNRIYLEIFKFLKAREFVLLLKLLFIGFRAFIKSI